MSDLPPLRLVGPSASISSHFVEGVNGPLVHLLDAEHEEPSQPCLLLQSFPVLAYPWREVMPPVAEAGTIERGSKRLRRMPKCRWAG
ncbi:hypothetical protein [Methylobacterium sp. ARG-1]|uniref:hypothetical protein n=1 Tax=Methylobacterium sp. ARG-1 TaxID=1692501 RepID=UPI000682B6F9|nr:hypothetical protein [Methylobacterium sp. ARG-1]KNY19710.1 hypothetical protein AKJ13_26050 [Methylobacterium sp. ARG-1]